ncbi:MAG: YihY/virulence factor BrkB family protein, partial [Nitrospiraceae bacterium]
MKFSRLVKLVTNSAAKWWDDNVLRLSAALSFYTLLSLAPLFTVAIAIGQVVVDEEAVHVELLRQFEDLIGKPGSEAMANMLHSTGLQMQGTIATVITFAILIIVSTGMFSELLDALNLIWRVPVKGWSAFWMAAKGRLLSFLLVIGTGFLLVISLVMNAMLTAVERFIQQELPWPHFIMSVVDGVGFPIVTALFFAFMFKALPDSEIAWGDVWWGAVIAAVLFSLGKWAIGVYLGGPALTSMYGAASSLMAILI